MNIIEDMTINNTTENAVDSLYKIIPFLFDSLMDMKFAVLTIITKANVAIKHRKIIGFLLVVISLIYLIF